MRHAMWMGTRGFEMWVPMPKISPTYSRVGFNSATGLLNGGATLRASKSAHQEYALEWNNGSWDDVQPIRDMADGLYDTQDGVNLIRFTDPVAAARNILPPHWAAPALGAEDAPSLIADHRPTAPVQAVSGFRLPARAASFDGSGLRNRSLYIPIPPGFTAHFGWVGTGGSVRLKEARAYNTGAEITPTPLDGNGVWTNAAVQRHDDLTGVEVSLDVHAVATIRAMTMQILPSGRAPRTNVPWPSGQGNSGCQFGDRTGLVPLSVGLDMVAATTTLVETGDWL